MERKQNIWNVPNLLTMLRMALIGVYLWLFFGNRLYPALFVFLLACLTDVLDGYIARKYQLITSFGKLMDPLADKLMVCSVLVSLAIKGWVPWWLIATVAVKELVMVLGGLFMLKAGVVVSANAHGKAATLAFMLAIVLTFFHEVTQPFDYALQLMALVLTLYALIGYAKDAVLSLRTGDRGRKG